MVNAFNDTADVGSGAVDWEFGAIFDKTMGAVSRWWDREDDRENTTWARAFQERQLDVAEKLAGTPNATKTPGSASISSNYQKWGLYVAIAGLVITLIAVFWKR